MSLQGRWFGVVMGVIMVLPVLAVETETGEMPLQAGFVDPGTGIKIEEIVISPKEDVQAVHMSVPASAGPIEEVIVRAKQPGRRVVAQKKPYTFVRDYEHDRYGLIIYLGKSETLPLRVYMNSSQQQPGSVTQ